MNRIEIPQSEYVLIYNSLINNYRRENIWEGKLIELVVKDIMTKRFCIQLVN